MDIGSPGTASRAAERDPELDRVAALAVSEFRAAPCAVVALAARHGSGWKVRTGAAGHLVPDGPEASPATIFDLASVSKPFTALCAARLFRSSLLQPDIPLAVPVREAQGTCSARTPLEMLLAHRAGLEGHRPLYAPLMRGKSPDLYQALMEAANARKPDCQGAIPEGGFPPTYSDLGYLLLGEALARASAGSLDDVVASQVCKPLGLRVGSARQWRNFDASFDDRVAPTEVVPWRGGVIRGCVHDENAWALAGDGLCGHAGMFGMAADVAALGAAVLEALAGRSDWLGPEDIRLLTTPRPGGTLRAGFDGKSEAGSSAGVKCSLSGFGHLGFTGTSLWVDPESEAAVVLLTNRVHPTRDSDAIKRARPAIHDALWAIAAD